MSNKLFEATCKHCREAGVQGEATRVTGYGNATGWRHDIKPAKPHSPWPTGTWRQIFTRKA